MCLLNRGIAMGGDSAPDMVVEGVQLALARYSSVRFILFGDKSKVDSLIKRAGISAERVTVQHAPEIITSEMKPSSAIRNSKGSSMRLAIESVASGKNNAVVSAGNTGAYMAMGQSYTQDY